MPSGLEIDGMDIEFPFKDYFRSGHQNTLNQAQVDQYMENLSSSLIQDYQLGGEPTVAHWYFTRKFDKDCIEFRLVADYYQNHIKTHACKEELVWIYKFMQNIIPDSLNKQNGVRYIRSKKYQFTVKPTPINGKCNELSEHCTEEEGMWYTCLNYMDLANGGVKPQQIARLVLHAQNKAAKNVMESMTLGSIPIAYENTEEAIDFKEQFGCDLLDISEIDYDIIAFNINENPKLLLNFLLLHVFPYNDILDKKLSGNTEHFVHMLKEFYGSSGTSNAHRALPDKNRKTSEEQPYTKRLGVDGNVLLALLKDFKEEDLIPYEIGDCLETAKQIAPHLSANKGSSLIDLAAYFAGKTADKIAQIIAPHMRKGAELRYKKGENKEETINSATLEIDSSSQNINEEEVNNILAKDEERGTHMEMGVNSIAFLTLNDKIALTEFMQACMRPRKLGKGQKLRYFIPKEMLTSFLDLFLIFFLNESKEVKKIHYKSEGQKIAAIADNAVFYGGLVKLKSRNCRGLLYSISKHLFEKSTQERLSGEDLDKVGKPVIQKTATEALVELAREEKDKIIALQKRLKLIQNPQIQQLVEYLDDAANTLQKKAEGKNLITPIFLPDFVDNRNGDLNTVSEAYKEHENQNQSIKEQDVDQDQMQEQWQALVSASDKMEDPAWEDLKIDSVETLMDYCVSLLGDDIGLKDSITPFYRLQDCLSFYLPNIGITRNLYPHNQFGHWGLQDPKLPLKTGLMRPTRVAIVVDQNRQNSSPSVYALLGSTKDFDHVFSHIDRPNSDKIAIDQPDFYIYNLYTDQLEGTNAHWASYSSHIQCEIALAIVQTKLFSGAFELLNPENKTVPFIYHQATFFEDWLIARTELLDLSPKRIELNFIKYLRRMRPSSIESYYSSKMHQIFVHAEKRIALKSKTNHQEQFYEKEMY